MTVVGVSTFSKGLNPRFLASKAPWGQSVWTRKVAEATNSLLSPVAVTVWEPGARVCWQSSVDDVVIDVWQRINGW